MEDFISYKMHRTNNVKGRLLIGTSITPSMGCWKDSVQYTRWNENTRYDNPASIRFHRPLTSWLFNGISTRNQGWHTGRASSLSLNTNIYYKKTTWNTNIYFLPLLRLVSKIFQQDGAPPHWGSHVSRVWDAAFPNRWIGRDGPAPWPPRSPDITPLDFFL